MGKAHGIQVCVGEFGSLEPSKAGQSIMTPISVSTPSWEEEGGET